MLGIFYLLNTAAKFSQDFNGAKSDEDLFPLVELNSRCFIQCLELLELFLCFVNLGKNHETMITGKINIKRLRLFPLPSFSAPCEPRARRGV